MDSARYGVALVMVVSLPPALLLWLVIHPFVHFWRRVGPTAAYACVIAILVGGIYGLVQLRAPLLAVEFGARWPMVVIGALCVAASSWLRLSIQRHFSTRVLAGLPELAPDRYPQRLVTDGPFARVRHPRYLQFLLALLGFALFANYLALWAVLALWLPGVWLIVVLEERELRERFGAEYDAYCRRVPRFLPRLRRS